MRKLLSLLVLVTPFVSAVSAQSLVTDESPNAAAEHLIDCEWFQGQVGAEVSLGVFPVVTTATGRYCSVPYVSINQNVGVVDNFYVIPRNAIGPGPQSPGFQSVTVVPAARQIQGWQ